jgi:hypothetical protein
LHGIKMGLGLPASVSFERLQAPFESASDALARFDERLRSSPVAEAFVLRTHFHDACAALWRVGEFVQIEDLVLHDAGTDVRTPTHELVRAHAVLLTRRHIADREPAWALTTDGLASLRGAWRPHGGVCEPTTGSRTMGEDAADGELDEEDDETIRIGEFDEIDELLARTSHVIERSEPAPLKRDDSGLVYDEDWNEEARVAEWHQRLGRTQNLPPLMAVIRRGALTPNRRGGHKNMQEQSMAWLRDPLPIGGQSVEPIHMSSPNCPIILPRGSTSYCHGAGKPSAHPLRRRPPTSRPKVSALAGIPCGYCWMGLCKRPENQ